MKRRAAQYMQRSRPGKCAHSLALVLLRVCGNKIWILWAGQLVTFYAQAKTQATGIRLTELKSRDLLKESFQSIFPNPQRKANCM